MGNAQRRADRGVLIVVATAMLVLAACDGGDNAPPTDQPTAATGARAEADALEIATGFVEAYGAFDADRAISYLADDFDIRPWVESSTGADAEGTLREFRLLLSLAKAERFRQALYPCEKLNSPTSDTLIKCGFDFHIFGSDEIGQGPFTGASYQLTVRGGEIVRASIDWDYLDDFSPQMWEPFAEWVSTTYPEDAAIMYDDPPDYDALAITEESIPLWREHVRDYVEAVQQGTA